MFFVGQKSLNFLNWSQGQAFNKKMSLIVDHIQGSQTAAGFKVVLNQEHLQYPWYSHSRASLRANICLSVEKQDHICL